MRVCCQELELIHSGDCSDLCIDRRNRPAHPALLGKELSKLDAGLQVIRKNLEALKQCIKK